MQTVCPASKFLNYRTPSEAIASRQGNVIDTFDDGQRLFTRSVLPHVELVRADDRVQGGVALRATGTEVWVHPYVFRLVCRNGAIIAQTLQTEHLKDLQGQEPEVALGSIREAIEVCCAAEAFAQTVQHMRTACEAQVDWALMMLPLLARHPATANSQFLSQIMSTFFREWRPIGKLRLRVNADYGNAKRDPQRSGRPRWNLEELGGRIATGQMPEALAHPGRATRTRRTEAVAVG